jgi:hypothetical protein
VYKAVIMSRKQFNWDVAGNAMSLMAECRRVMRVHHEPKELIDQMFKEGTSGDYDNVIQVCMKYTDKYENEEQDGDNDDE